MTAVCTCLCDREIERHLTCPQKVLEQRRFCQTFVVRSEHLFHFIRKERWELEQQLPIDQSHSTFPVKVLRTRFLGCILHLRLLAARNLQVSSSRCYLIFSRAPSKICIRHFMIFMQLISVHIGYLWNCL